MNVELGVLLDFVIKHGGAIVSSNELSSDKITHKRACGRMHVTKDGLGLVYMSSEELNKRQSDIIRHTVQYIKNECCSKSIDEISEVDAIKFFNENHIGHDNIFCACGVPKNRHGTCCGWHNAIKHESHINHGDARFVLKIGFTEYGRFCSAGCCYDYGTITTVNGVELQCHNQDTETILRQILEHLGYVVDIDFTNTN